MWKAQGAEPLIGINSKLSFDCLIHAARTVWKGLALRLGSLYRYLVGVTSHQRKVSAIVENLLEWYSKNARDLPWRRTTDPYAIHVSEIMLQQTQVKTVIPFWNRWMRALPTIEAAAKADSGKLHKLWEGLGYYTRVRNLQKAAQVIVEQHGGKFPEKFEAVLELPGIGRYTAGAICSIAFHQPTPLLDGNVIRVLTRIFGIAENPKEKSTNQHLWKLAEELVLHASRTCHAEATRRQVTDHDAKSRTRTRTKHEDDACSALNQSLMELGALICTPRSPQCLICPVKKLCVAFLENRVEELPSLGKREAPTARQFVAFVVERNGKFLVLQRPTGVVNAHLWEFPNVEMGARVCDPQPPSLANQTGPDTAAPHEAARHIFGFAPGKISRLITIKHSITRHRITLEAFTAEISSMKPPTNGAVWKTRAQMHALAFTSAHRKILRAVHGPAMADACQVGRVTPRAPRAS